MREDLEEAAPCRVSVLSLQSSIPVVCVLL